MTDRLIDALPILSTTAIPAVVLLAVAYVARPQGGRRWLLPRPVSARDVIRRLEAERAEERPTWLTDWTTPSTEAQR